MIDRKHIGWIDFLRVMACAMVVLAHCCDGFVAQFDADRSTFLTGVFAGSLFRPSVPLFVMMTGVLLLPLPQPVSLTAFYRKRVGRIVWPLIFWSLALPLLAYMYFTGAGIRTANPSVDMSAYTPDGLTNRLWSWVLNFNFDTTPLWYVYMLVGLYLIMPVLSAWLTTASRRDIKNFLILWFATLFIPYIKLFAPAAGYLGNYGNMDILGGCDWNAFGLVYYVSGFIGYLVLAYYLRTYPLQWSARKMCAVLIPMFLAGYAITSLGYITLQNYYPGDYAYLEVIWLFCGVNVFLMTFPVFVTVQRINPPSGSMLRKLATLTFGIYLCHFIFVMMSYDLYAIASIPVVIRIILMGITTFAVAAVLTWALRLNKFTSKFVS
ncbi:MAG: acyltransferase family protein [Muribaculaceae bacterium]|nr:acyltransferase family protein [Muribaculaceae bacterium]